MTVAELLELLEALGSTPSPESEGLTELDHGLQCAYELLRVRPADRPLQVAGLVHDVGHRFGSDEAHGRLGARHVRGALGDRVASAVEGHVPAKRYLVTVDPSYASALSEVSRQTLRVQGGPLPPAEVAAFESSAFFADALELRRADDAAKVPGRRVPGLDYWASIVEDLAT